MIQNTLLWIKSKFGLVFLAGNARTVRTKKNIIALIFLRGISMVAGFVIVPMTLHYLSPVKYGVWLTISSVIGWFTFFDIGLGNGFRNKFAEALAKNDTELARVYVSTTYSMLIFIISIISLLFIIVNPFLNWASIFNAPANLSSELSFVVTITFSFFCFRFVFGLIGMILLADQRPASNSLIDVLGNATSLIVIWFLLHLTKGSLLNLSIGLGACNALVPIGASIVLFSAKYKNIRPSIKYVQLSHAKELVSLGSKFFVLQISSLVIFSSSNIVISQLFSPADVVPYNIAFKYYNLISMIVYLVLLPFWSAYTEAYARGDIPWIQATIDTLKRFWILIAVLVIIMSLFANTFYMLWVGKEIQIPISISITMGLYVIIISWSSIYGNLINGIGTIRLALINAIVIGILNIPLAIYFAKYIHLGIPGVILATCTCLLPGCFLWPIQVKKILSGKATGIWGR